MRKVRAGEGWIRGLKRTSRTPENECSEDCHGNIVGRHRVDAAVLVVFADARTQEPPKNQRDDAALQMHHRGAGEVHMPVTQAEIDAQLREPAAAPDPVAEYRIHHRADAAAINHERGKLPALSCATRWDGRRRVHEHHLEQEQAEQPGVISIPGQEKPCVPRDFRRACQRWS